MWLIPISARCYSGHKADETPRAICISDKWLDVIEVIDRWHQTKPDPEWPIADYFKVLCNDNRIYLIKHDIESDEWFSIKSWESDKI